MQKTLYITRQKNSTMNSKYNLKSIKHYISLLIYCRSPFHSYILDNSSTLVESGSKTSKDMGFLPGAIATTAWGRQYLLNTKNLIENNEVKKGILPLLLSFSNLDMWQIRYTIIYNNFFKMFKLVELEISLFK